MDLESNAPIRILD